VDLIRPAQIAETLGVSERWLRNRVRELCVPHVDLGRGRMAFTPEHYAALLAALERGGSAPTPRSQARRRGRAA
jgi:hypothetical protein